MKPFTPTQKELIEIHLKQGKSITPQEAVKFYRIWRLGAIIHVLRRHEGWNISTTIIRGETDGRRYQYAKYKLEKGETI